MRRFTKFIIEQTILLNEHIEQLWKQFEDRITNRKFNKIPSFSRGGNVNMSNVDSWKEYLTGELDVHPKAHHPWLLSRYIADPKFTEENFEHASYLLKKLSDLRKVGAVPEHITSKNFKTYEHLNGYVSNFLGTKKYPSPDEYRAQADAKLHSENEHWQIIHVKNHQAACKFGMNAKWCTAGTDLLPTDPEYLKKIEYDEQGNLKTDVPYSQTYRSGSEQNFQNALESRYDTSPLSKRGLFIAIPKSEKAKRMGKFQFSTLDHGDVDYSELRMDKILEFFDSGHVSTSSRLQYEIKDARDNDPNFLKDKSYDDVPEFTDKFYEHNFPKEFVELLEKPLQFHAEYGSHSNVFDLLKNKVNTSYTRRISKSDPYEIPKEADIHLRRLSNFFYHNPNDEHPHYHYRYGSSKKVDSEDYNEFVQKLPIQHYGHFRDVNGEAKKLKPLIDGSRDASYKADDYYNFITNLGTKKLGDTYKKQPLGDVYDEWQPEKRTAYFENAVKAIATAGYYVPQGPRYAGIGWTNETYNNTYTRHNEALGPHYLIQFFKDMYHPEKASAHDNGWIKYTKDQLSRFAPHEPKPDDGFEEEIEFARKNGNTLYRDINYEPVRRATYGPDYSEILKTHKESQFPFVSDTYHHLNKDDYDSVMRMANEHLEKFG